MTDSPGNEMNDKELSKLETAFHRGAAEASEALAKWIGKRSVIEVDAVKQIPLEEATGVLSAGEEPMCFCLLQMDGEVRGEMILAFDDASGLALADMLLEQPPQTAESWGELEISAALETANIICSAYLNALSRSLPDGAGDPTLLPTPPTFRRDFAESLIQFALMGQAMVSDQVIFALTRFEIDAVQVNWTLLLVPEAESMDRLRELLTHSSLE